ncbi:scavenger receptor class F member 1 [Heterodontus francisci]|uniref:scavenger receptor class F member 1 n=1 Tax=Heterodontus francisci TaxID=7792 RepID=UPI00355B0D0F
MGPLLLLVSLYPLTWSSHIQELNPNGTNVCPAVRVPPSLSCCPGWRQQGNECPIAICEPPSSCSPEEICVRPGVCRCPHGFFGASCVTRCPEQFWGPDCRNVCVCHPNGKCNAVTGNCTCNQDRWGPNCARRCRCQRGHCDPGTGHCRCETGWWGADCSKMCLCEVGHSLCDPTTGKCNCSSGYWGKRCNIPCFCTRSSCTQHTGVCECREGWWGTRCERRCACVQGKCNPRNGQCVCHAGYQGRTCSEPCTAGLYGEGCRRRCGRCKEAQPCSPVDGACQPCEPGWNGSRCDQPCSPGFHGEHCEEKCPTCRDGEFCNVVTGICHACNPGWSGPRCDSPCVSGTFGIGCHSTCPECYHGKCHHISGDCICDVGYSGTSCNSTCSEGSHGMNCSLSCRCLGAACDHVTGVCHFSKTGVVIAAVMVSLLIVLCTFCCCCCGYDKNDPKSRMLGEGHGPIARMKHHVQGVLANLGSAVPCLSFGNQKLPKVTVSHHDADISFNCSFIDSPSAAWDSVSFSSFETDDEEPVYCVPPQEGCGFLAPAGGFQELSSRCNYFPAEQADLSSEHGLQPLSIPRTSSIVKAKRPSVSFAEGTKFGPEVRRGSMPESRVIPTMNTQRKRKLSCTLSKLTPIRSEPGASDSPPVVCQPYECTNLPGVYPETEALPRPCKPSARTRAGEHRCTSSTTKKASPAREREEMLVTSGDPKVAANDQKVTTVYVMAGEAKRSSKIWGSSADGIGVGTVQAMLRRFGSFPKQRSSPKEELRPRSRGENISKVHRKLAALHRNCKHQSPDNMAACADELKRSKENSLSRFPIIPSSATQQTQAVSNATLTKKPLIPTTPILRKLVANVAEDTENRLDMIPSPAQRDNPPEQDGEDGHQGCEDIPTEEANQEIQ